MRLYVALMSYSGRPCAQTMASLTTSLLMANQLGWHTQWDIKVGNSLVSKARNDMVAHFLASDCDTMVFVDDDGSWQPADFCKLAALPVDVVAAVFRTKSDTERYAFRGLDDAEVNEELGLLEVEAAGTGLMKLSRACLATMVASYGNRWYHAASLPGGKGCALFDVQLRDHTYWGEDITFCHRWRAIGGKVWVASNVTLHHHGNKTYTGNLHEWLKRQQPEEQSAA